MTYQDIVCDLTIAADHACFGQVGPKVGSVDPGFGTVYLARVVGQDTEESAEGTNAFREKRAPDFNRFRI